MTNDLVRMLGNSGGTSAHFELTSEYRTLVRRYHFLPGSDVSAIVPNILAQMRFALSQPRQWVLRGEFHCIKEDGHYRVVKIREDGEGYSISSAVMTRESFSQYLVERIGHVPAAL